MIDAFVHLLKSPYIEIVEKAIWGLYNLACDSQLSRDLIIATGA